MKNVIDLKTMEKYSSKEDIVKAIGDKAFKTGFSGALINVVKLEDEIQKKVFFNIIQKNIPSEDLDKIQEALDSHNCKYDCLPDDNGMAPYAPASNGLERLHEHTDTENEPKEERMIEVLAGYFVIQNGKVIIPVKRISEKEYLKMLAGEREAEAEVERRKQDLERKEADRKDLMKRVLEEADKDDQKKDPVKVSKMNVKIPEMGRQHSL